MTALAAAKATPSDLRKLESILRTAEEETSATKLLELDVEFHVMVPTLRAIRCCPSSFAS